MNKRWTQKGQALILVAAALIGLVAMVGLAVDGGASFTERRHAQSAADAAVLAAALARVNNQSQWRDVARQVAGQNGYQTAQITINNPPSSQDCDPNDGVSSPYVGNSEYVQVIIRSTVTPYFSQVVGRQQFNVCAESVARAKAGSPGGLLTGAGIVTTKTTGNHTFLLNGSAEVKVHGAGIHVNSNGNQALFLNGGAKITMDQVGAVVGGYGMNGGASISPGMQVGMPQLTINSETFAAIPAIPPAPTCSQNGTVTTNGNTMTFTPGTFSGITINGGMTANFQPGVYCINNYFNLNGSATLNAPSGRITFVTGNVNITFNGGVTLNISDIEVYTNNGTWTLNGSNTFIVNRIRFYSTGSGQWIVNGGSTVKANDAFFYLKGGYITWNGSSNIDLKAPPAGDPFAGLLVYMPLGNTSNVIFNGGSNIKLTGTYLAPDAPMTVNGSVNVNAIRSQIIVSTLIVNGGTTLDVTYNPSENFGIPQPGFIELAQ